MNENQIDRSFERFKKSQKSNTVAIIVHKFIKWNKENKKDISIATPSDIILFMEDEKKGKTNANIISFTYAINRFLKFIAEEEGSLCEEIEAPETFEGGAEVESASSLIYLTKSEYEQVRDQMHPGSRDKLIFILSWYGYTPFELEELRRDEVKVQGEMVTIQDKVIRDIELAKTFNAYSETDAFKVEIKNSDDFELLFGSNIENTPIAMDPFKLRGKLLSDPIPFQNIFISGAAWLYQEQFKEYENLESWAEEIGIMREDSIKARDVAGMLYGSELTKRDEDNIRIVDGIQEQGVILDIDQTMKWVE